MIISISQRKFHYFRKYYSYEFKSFYIVNFLFDLLKCENLVWRHEVLNSMIHNHPDKWRHWMTDLLLSRSLAQSASDNVFIIPADFVLNSSFKLIVPFNYLKTHWLAIECKFPGLLLNLKNIPTANKKIWFTNLYNI